MKKQLTRSAVVIGALALAAAACGSSSTSPTDIGAADEAPTGGELPPVDSPEVGPPAEDPVVEPACLPDEPQCEEMIVEDEDQEMPVPDEGTIDTAGGAISSGMTVDGGLTVTEALATDALGILAVQGHFYDDGSGPTLCEALEGGGERYVCGGPQLAIDNFDPGTVVADFIIHDGLTYTEEPLTLFGELQDGILSLDNLVAG